MLSPRALTTTSESGNSRRAAMDNGESARPMERACTMSSSVTSTHLPHARITEHLHHDRNEEGAGLDRFFVSLLPTTQLRLLDSVSAVRISALSWWPASLERGRVTAP